MRTSRLINLAFFVLGIGGMLILTGCPKKVDTAKSTAVVEEEVVAPPRPVEPPPPAPRVEEIPVARELEMTLREVYFDYDKSNIRPDARATLEKVAAWMNKNPNAKLKIEGHCDERGTNEYNLALGQRRSKAVRDFLAAMGVSGGRLSTISFGEERPVCTDPSESCYARNRRGLLVTQ